MKFSNNILGILLIAAIGSSSSNAMKRMAEEDSLSERPTKIQKNAEEPVMLRIITKDGNELKVPREICKNSNVLINDLTINSVEQIVLEDITSTVLSDIIIYTERAVDLEKENAINRQYYTEFWTKHDLAKVMEADGLPKNITHTLALFDAAHFLGFRHVYHALCFLISQNLTCFFGHFTNITHLSNFINEDQINDLQKAYLFIFAIPFSSDSPLPSLTDAHNFGFISEKIPELDIKDALDQILAGHEHATNSLNYLNLTMTIPCFFLEPYEKLVAWLRNLSEEEKRTFIEKIPPVGKLELALQWVNAQVHKSGYLIDFDQYIDEVTNWTDDTSMLSDELLIKSVGSGSYTLPLALPLMKQFIKADIIKLYINGSTTNLDDKLHNLFQLQSLVIFNLKSNKCGGSFWHLKKLHKLAINQSDLTSLPDDINCLVNLKELYLKDVPLTNLPEGLGDLINLHTLYICKSELSEVPLSFKNLVGLEKITVIYSKFKIIPQVITELPQLSYLDFSHNILTCMPENIGNLSKLKHLLLSFNEITVIPQSVKDNKSMEIEVVVNPVFWLSKPIFTAALELPQLELAPPVLPQPKITQPEIPQEEVHEEALESSKAELRSFSHLFDSSSSEED